MKQTQAPKGGKRAARRRRKRRALICRRIFAGVLAALAVALGVAVARLPFGPGSLMWGAACGLLLAEAALLLPRRKVSRLLRYALGVICLALLATGFLHNYYARSGGCIVPKYTLVRELRVEKSYPAHFTQMASLESLDMRGSTVTDFEPLYALASLKYLDIRDNYAFDTAAHDALAQALPECDIRWSVPVTGAHFDSASEAVDLSGLELSAAELRGLLARFPAVRFLYRVPLFGARYAQDAEALDLTGQTPDAGAIDDALSLLPQVRTVDLRGVAASPQTVALLCDAHPDVRFMFTCDVPGGGMTTEDETVTIRGSYEDLLGYMAYIDYMPNLKIMDASSVPLTDAQLTAIQSDAHKDKLLYRVDVFGVKVTSLDTEVNLDGVKVPGVAAVETLLQRLPNLKKISLCDSGLSDGEMDMLFKAHPDVKFVWLLKFGHYTLRTDATSFTTAQVSNNHYDYNDDTFACLRYCTDLQMLDLGHNKIRSLENFKDLKELRVLIMADNKLTDISPIANMEKLEYVELFLNDITDLTPLTGLTHLMDLNLFYNPVGSGYKALKSMTWLKRLWIGGCKLSKGDVSALREALPDTQVNVRGSGSTDEGWREHPHYFVIKQMYQEERYVPFEDSYTE